MPSLTQLKIALALLAGWMGALNVSFYPQGGSLILAVLGVAVALSLLLTPASRRGQVWCGLLLVFALTFGGWPGAVVAVGLSALLAFRPDLLERREALDQRNWDQTKLNNTEALANRMLGARTRQDWDALMASGEIQRGQTASSGKAQASRVSSAPRWARARRTASTM